MIYLDLHLQVFKFKTIIITDSVKHLDTLNKMKYIICVIITINYA